MSTDAKKSPCLREAMTDLVGSIDFFFIQILKTKRFFILTETSCHKGQKDQE